MASRCLYRSTELRAVHVPVDINKIDPVQDAALVSHIWNRPSSLCSTVTFPSNQTSMTSLWPRIKFAVYRQHPITSIIIARALLHDVKDVDCLPSRCPHTRPDYRPLRIVSLVDPHLRADRWGEWRGVDRSARPTPGSSSWIKSRLRNC